MKPGKEAVLLFEANRLVARWACAFNVSEDEAREHLTAALSIAFDGLTQAQHFGLSGAMRKETTIVYECRAV